jgi:hypothetical protein
LEERAKVVRGEGKGAREGGERERAERRTKTARVVFEASGNKKSHGVKLTDEEK